MRQLKQDSSGIVMNVGIATLLGLILLMLALFGWALQSTFLWDYSWALIMVAALLLTGKLLGMNLWALIIVPVFAGALWVFGVMGGL